ncbi:SNHG14 isoform 26 [Pan troglodytes]|uniref:SNHG14 isoform 26 n=1 Tax=Pan troglodytes TaxID=9598 RepID=A0A2J8KLH7_PANTR|nr:SNHG14 isoform 26 [Pan troglodytes]
MALGQCLSASFPAPGALKLRPFLASWSPALGCVSASALAGHLALTGIVSSSAQVVPAALSGIDGEPGGRCVGPAGRGPVSLSQVLSSQWAETLTLPGTLLSCTVLCELFHLGGPLGIDWHRW